MQQQTFKLPNALICDTRLSYTARRIGATLYAYRNALGFCLRSAAELAILSGCSSKTVRGAIRELTAAGYIHSARSYRYHERLHRLVYGKNAYTCSLNFDGGFTLIPRHIFTCEDLTPAAFCVYLYLFYAAGNKHRAYPSISRIMRIVGAAHSTVCRVLSQLKKLPGIFAQHCKKTNGAFAASSYYIVCVLRNISQRKQSEMADQPESLHTIILTAVRRFCNRFLHKAVVRFLPSIS